MTDTSPTMMHSEKQPVKIHNIFQEKLGPIERDFSAG